MLGYRGFFSPTFTNPCFRYSPIVNVENLDFENPRFSNMCLVMHLSIVSGTGQRAGDPREINWAKLPLGRDLTDNCILSVGKLKTRGRIDNCVFFNFLKFLRSIELR